MKILNIHHLHGKVPPGAVYIGRANQKYGLPQSKWHNPFYLSDPSNDQLRQQVLEQYTADLDQKIQSGKITVTDLLELSGKDLVCFCAPRLCHGHPLAERVAWAEQQKPLLEVPTYSGRWKR